jgi:ribonuclease P protein component
MKNTFAKSEKLCSKKVIEELFKTSSSVFLYPFKLAYLTREEVSTELPKVLVTASKRNFKKAHQRNKVKRKIKEAYRIAKPHYFSSPHQIASIAIIFVAKTDDIPFPELQVRMEKAIKRLLTSKI